MLQRAFPVLSLLALVAGPAPAGPPTICWLVEIGEAESLPWGDGDFERSKKYRLKQLVPDTLRLLKPTAPVLVRMETLRRAAIYCERERKVADRLMRALMLRVLRAEAMDQPDPFAWFDAGYAAGCFRQLQMADDIDGYAWVKKSMRLRGDDPVMHHACALLTLMELSPHHEEFKGHFTKAAAGAMTDPLLAANVKTLAKFAPGVLKYFEDKAKTKKKG